MLLRYRNYNIKNDPLSIKLYLLLAVFSFSIPFGLVYWAQQFVPTGLSSILFAVYPFAVILFSRLLIPADKIGPYKITGIFLGFSGIFTIFSKNLNFEVSGIFFGMLAILISSAMQAAVAVIMKKYGNHLNPLSMNLVPLIFAGFILLSAGIIFEDTSEIKFDFNGIFSVLYLASMGTALTFTTFYWLLKRVNVVILSFVTFITPVVAVLLGWLILGESLSIREFIGGGMVLVGIIVSNYKGILTYIKSSHKQLKKC